MQTLAQAEVILLMRNLLTVIFGLCDSGVKVENRVTVSSNWTADWNSWISNSGCLFCLPSLTPMVNTHESIFHCCTKEFYCKINTKLVDSTGKTEITFFESLSVLKEVVVECFGSVWGALVIYLNRQKLHSMSGASHYLLLVSFPLTYVADMQVQVATGSQKTNSIK